MHYARAFLAVLCIAILLVAPVAFAADFTFTDGNATGVWHDQDNWFDGVSNGIPDVGDTATIPASKICKVEAAQAEACDSLTVQDGGKLEVNAAGGSLTVDDFTVEDGGMIEIFGGGELDTAMFTIESGGDVVLWSTGELEADDFEIESGGKLQVRRGGTLHLPAAATVILDGTIQYDDCSGALTQGIVLIDDDVTIQGDGAMIGGIYDDFCPVLFTAGAGGASLTLEHTGPSNRLELFNIGRFGVDVENNADVILNNVDSNVSILDGYTASGSGNWITTAGCMKFDGGSTLTGSATFTMAGDPLDGRTITECSGDEDDCAWFVFSFDGSGATTDDFDGTLEFTSGTATFLDDFEHCGDFAFGGDENLNLEVDVNAGDIVELGKGACN